MSFELSVNLEYMFHEAGERIVVTVDGRRRDLPRLRARDLRHGELLGHRRASPFIGKGQLHNSRAADESDICHTAVAGAESRAITGKRCKQHMSRTHGRQRGRDDLSETARNALASGVAASATTSCGC